LEPVTPPAGQEGDTPFISGVTTSELPAQSEFPSERGIENGGGARLVEAVRLAAGLGGGAKMAVREGRRAR